MWGTARRKEVTSLSGRIQALTPPEVTLTLTDPDGSGPPFDSEKTLEDPIELYSAAWSRWSSVRTARAAATTAAAAGGGGGTAGSDGAKVPHPSEAVIPRFHFGTPPTKDDAYARAVAQEHFSRHADQAVGNTELKSLWTCLKAHGEVSLELACRSTGADRPPPSGGLP